MRNRIARGDDAGRRRRGVHARHGGRKPTGARHPEPVRSTLDRDRRRPFRQRERPDDQALGVDRPGTEYACEQGWGDSDGDDPADAAAADAAAIASWHANAVRVPLNEDCWLGINNEPAYETASDYQEVVQQYVAELNADGIYAIRDLHRSASGSTVADGQRPMPDDHSAVFWTSVATTFTTDPAVLFDAFNEPYSPAADYPGDRRVAADSARRPRLRE